MANGSVWPVATILCKPKKEPTMTFDARRRKMLKVTAVTGGAFAVSKLFSGTSQAEAAQGSNAEPAAQGIAPVVINVVLHVNGAEHPMTLDPRTTLLDALREHLQLV